MLKNILAIVLALTAVTLQAQPQPDASEILLKLKKLNFLGSVLYVAAHPDDENTQMIAYLENARYARVAYLALTRGDGGQNLIGPEIREALGVIRTQELLAARRTDGGEQFFSRANDFGYSKNADETLSIWDRQQVLSDVVRTYRRFRPDVIITRFPPDSRAGHGHHTSSAIMAQEAFDLSGSESSFPEQLDKYETWQPVRLFTNTGRWWNPDMTGDEPGVVAMDVGTYNPLLGESMTEIAALSRSQHKSQGFGVTGSRGEELEFLEFEMGEPAEDDLFQGIDTSWGRVEGGNQIGEKIEALINGYDLNDPSATLAGMLEVRKIVSELDDPFWRDMKLKEIDLILRDITGLYLEARASDWRLYPGEEAEISFEVINRSPRELTLGKVKMQDNLLTPDVKLENNRKWEYSMPITVPENKEFSNPYWLREKGTLGMYKVSDESMIGKPENPPVMEAELEVSFSGTVVSFSVPVIYKWTDPVKGEQRRPLVIAPPAVVEIPTPVHLFPSGISKMIDVVVTSYLEGAPVTVSLEAGDGWKIEPSSQEIGNLNPSEPRTIQFEVTPPTEENTSELNAYVEAGGKRYEKSELSIRYDHIPAQTIFPKAQSRLVNIPIRKYGHTIGYVQGAGDAVPETLRELGYDVRELQAENITQENLESLSAVILGVRALNTIENIGAHMDDLLTYVQKGGTLIVQYNTSHRLKTDNFSPYPLTLSRDRVADENAPVTILAPDHPVVNEPNVILPGDFDNWVQERGLYFPDKWDDAFVPILSSNDPGEDARNGGLLVAPYGNGHYIYTGYSWFRELPAGVPGAIKLFTNLVSLGSDQSSTDRNGE